MHSEFHLQTPIFCDATYICNSIVLFQPCISPQLSNFILLHKLIQQEWLHKAEIQVKKQCSYNVQVKTGISSLIWGFYTFRFMIIIFEQGKCCSSLQSLFSPFDNAFDVCVAPRFTQYTCRAEKSTVNNNPSIRKSTKINIRKSMYTLKRK